VKMNVNLEQSIEFGLGPSLCILGGDGAVTNEAQTAGEACDENRMTKTRSRLG